MPYHLLRHFIILSVWLPETAVLIHPSSALLGTLSSFGKSVFHPHQRHCHRINITRFSHESFWQVFLHPPIPFRSLPTKDRLHRMELLLILWYFLRYKRLLRAYFPKYTHIAFTIFHKRRCRTPGTGVHNWYIVIQPPHKFFLLVLIAPFSLCVTKSC